MTHTKTNVEIWLKEILKNEDIENFDVQILGNSEKGDGFIGDIVYVSAIGTSKHGKKQLKKYNLVLKCSKNSQALREQFPIQAEFLNEKFFYNTIYPRFVNFELEKGIKDPFLAVPKYYGAYLSDSAEIIGLENLKEAEYVLWAKTKPLPRSHIDKVVREYGKFHAISVAFHEQHPKEFEKFASESKHIFEAFLTAASADELFKKWMDEAIDLLKDEVDESVTLKWKNFRKDNVYHDNIEGLKVIIHGDCWSNNFMYRYSQPSNPEGSITNCILMDFQLSRLTSPIYDLSYFIFTCISQEDLLDVDSILKSYYQTFSEHLQELGSNAAKLYPPEQFYDEWKRFCKYGIFLASGIVKMVSADKNELDDLVELAESGKESDNFCTNFFSKKIKNTDIVKGRLKHIFEFVVNNDLI